METLKESMVSIVVPSYNAESFVGQFIENIKSQSYSNWELIIVDDGSLDNTIEIIKEYQSYDSRIILLLRDRDPKGSVTCRNIGQLHSKGDYIIHFDIDDYIEPFCLYQRVVFMESHPSIDYATSRGGSVKKDENGFLQKVEREWGVDPKRDLISCFLEVDYPFSVWNNIYRSNMFKNIIWDEKVKIYTDFSYIIPVLVSGESHSFIIDSKPDYFYVINNANAMTSVFVSEEKFLSTLYLFDKTIQQLKKNVKYKYYLKNFRRYYNLQFERLLISGSEGQIRRFIKFYGNTYGTIRIRVIFTCLLGCLRKGKKKNFQRKVRIFIYSCFYPKLIVKLIFLKIGKNV